MTKTNSPWDKAIRFISFRPRTEHEVRQHLGPDCTGELISRLKDLNFINDTEYAKNYVQSRQSRSPRSALALKLELKRRGINLLPPINDLVAAATALQKKPRSWTKMQAYRFLQSRGFSFTTIEKVLKNKYNTANVWRKS